MMDEAAAREIEHLERYIKLVEFRAEFWEGCFMESERQRKQLSEYIEMLGRGGIEAATGAGK